MSLHPRDNIPLVNYPGPPSAEVRPAEATVPGPENVVFTDMEAAAELARVVGAEKHGTSKPQGNEADKRWELTKSELDWFERKPIDPLRSLSDDIIWVSNVLDLPELRLDQIPSLRAYSLWKWAKEYRKDFYNSTLPSAEKERLKAAGAGGGDDEWVPDDLDDGLEKELRLMLTELIKESQHVRISEAGLVELPAKEKR